MLTGFLLLQVAGTSTKRSQEFWNARGIAGGCQRRPWGSPQDVQRLHKAHVWRVQFVEQNSCLKDCCNWCRESGEYWNMYSIVTEIELFFFLNAWESKCFKLFCGPLTLQTVLIRMTLRNSRIGELFHQLCQRPSRKNGGGFGLFRGVD